MTGLLSLLLALAWVAIASCGYLLWIHHKSAHTPTAHEEPQIARLGEDAARVEAKVAELESKVAELEGIRELRCYGNEAIADGNRSALCKLDEYAAEPRIEALKETATAEIIRVESYYITTRRFRAFPGEMPPVPESEQVAGISKILLEGGAEWGIRAQAARMLGEMRENVRAADALAEASHADPNLYVVQESILAFSSITGFRSTGVFDSSSVTEWWTENRANFGQVIRPRTPRSPAPPPPGP